MKKNNNKKDDDWFANVEQEIEKNKTTGVKSNETLEDSSLFGPSEPQQRKSKQSQKQHGTVYNKTQQFLSSKGVGWLMETVDQPASSTTSQENILGGDAAEQKQPSILEELDIDLYDIFWRVKQVLLTFREYDEETQRKLLLKDEGDFWGPFFIVLAFALVNISFSQMKIITWVFVVWFLGSFCLWLLVRLIAPQQQENTDDQETKEATTSTLTEDYLYFGQVNSFVGYGLIPHVVAQLLVSLWHMLPLLSADMNSVDTAISYLLNGLALFWSTYSCSKLICASLKSLAQKSRLILWPVLLFYLYFLVLVPSSST